MDSDVLLIALNARYAHTNLAVRYLSAALRQEHISAEIFEATINDHIGKLTAEIEKRSYKLAAFSCYIWNIELALALASRLKKINPALPILLGGPEVSYDAPQIMREHPYIDGIICGEGEEVISDAVRYLLGEIADIPEGLCTGDHATVFRVVKDLSVIPFPYSGGIETIKDRILYYESVRGCPYHCSYCLSGADSGVRFLPLERVLRELQFLSDGGAGLVKFVDRTFNCDRSRARAIWRFVATLKSKTCWHFEIAGDLLQEEDIQLLNAMPKGKIQLEIGVQTTNEQVLSNITRHSRLDALKDAVLKLCKPDNIQIHLDLIAGLPGENRESFIQSFNEVYSWKPHMLQLGFLKMLRGAVIRNDTTIIYDEHPPYEILYNQDMTFSDIALLHRVEEMVDRYYNSGSFALTLRYAVTLFPSPFYLFLALSDRAEQHEGNIGETGLYEMLFHLLTEKGNAKIAAQLLKFDYLYKCRRSSLPSFLPQNNSSVCKEVLMNHEAYASLRLVERAKVGSAADFDLDIQAYKKSGELLFTPIFVLFDYRESPAKLYFSVNAFDGTGKMD